MKWRSVVNKGSGWGCEARCVHGQIQQVEKAESRADRRWEMRVPFEQPGACALENCAARRLAYGEILTKISLVQPGGVFPLWQPSWVKTCHPVVTERMLVWGRACNTGALLCTRTRSRRAAPAATRRRVDGAIIHLAFKKRGYFWLFLRWFVRHVLRWMLSVRWREVAHLCVRSVRAHSSVCQCARALVCVCAHLDGTPPCEYREQRRNLNMRDHVETEMRCLRVNKINNTRPFSLFNKRASYRPVL